MKITEKIIIINDKEENLLLRVKNIFTKILIVAISLALIVGVLYLAILTSIFLIILFLSFGVISFLVMKFKNKKNYYKMD